jgi:thioesterase domain-containing protein
MAEISQHDTGNVANGLVRLRNGTTDAPIFLFSGADGNPHALTSLALRMRDPRALIAVDFCRCDNNGQLPSTIEIMAAHSCAAIRALQPRGPYRLVGYSFGGLLAIAIARLLEESGEEIALLGLIDTFFDQRFWPTPIFLRSQARVARRYLAMLRGLPLNQMVPMLLTRSKRLFVHLVRRQMPSSLAISAPKAESASAIVQHCRALMSNHRPKHYSGKITCFDAATHADFGCDPAELWDGWATEIERWSISGTHVGIVIDDASLTELAAALDCALAAHLPDGVTAPTRVAFEAVGRH